jgi:foldase protein PrsA
MSIVKMRKWFAKRFKILMGTIAVAFFISCFYFYGSTLYIRRKTPQEEKTGIIAEVNGEKIKKEEFEDMFSRFLSNYEREFETRVKGIDVERMKADFLENLIDNTLKIQLARKEKIKVKKRDVENQINKIAEEILKREESKFSSKEEFEKRLKEKKYTREKLLQEIRQTINPELAKEQAIFEKLEENFKKKVKMSEKEVRDKYEQVKIRHIYFQFPIPLGATEEEKKKYAEVQKEKIRKKAEEILQKIKSGEDFSKLANKYSDYEYSRQRGGELGMVTRDQLKDMGFEKEFIDAAFSLKKGEISNVVEVKSGYHIIKIEDKKEAKGKEFENEKKNLLEQKQIEEYNKYFENFKKKAKINIYDSQIRAYKEDLKGNWDKAIKEYQKAIREKENDPYLPYIYYNLGKLYDKKGKLQEAIQYYKEALKILPREAQFHFSLGEVYEKKNLKDMAFKEFLKASELSFEDDLYLHLMLQSAFQRLGKTELAEKEKKIVSQIQQKQQEKFMKMFKVSAQPVEVKTGKPEKNPQKK